MKSQYGDFEYGPFQGDDFCTSSFELIARIAEDPIIARFIVKANLKEDCPPEDDEQADAHIQRALLSSNVLSLLENSPYVQRSGIDAARSLESMIAQYTPDDCNLGLTQTLLLSLLPNVTEMSLPKLWEVEGDGMSGSPSEESLRQLSDLLNDIVNGANNPAEPNAALSRLTTIHPSSAWDYNRNHYPWQLSTFAPFLCIKSLKNFCAGDCRATCVGGGHIIQDELYKFVAPENKNFGAGLEVVELVGACVDSTELRNFLSPMRNLRSFKLSFNGDEWEADEIISVIEEEVGGTLEELSLSILYCFGDSGMGIDSMKKFTKLKELEIDIQLFLGPQHRIIFEGPLGTHLPPLGDILPRSVTKLTLLAGYLGDYTQALNWLFADIDIPAGIEEKLPVLKEIIFRNGMEGEIEGEPLADLEQDDSDEDEKDGSQTDSGDGKLDATAEIEVEKGDGHDSGQTLDSDAEIPSERAPETWREDLEALGTSIDIKFVKVAADDHGVSILPSFMRNFCDRYDLEIY
jgi:hypothetical protein